MNHEPFTGSGDIAATNEINIPLEMKEGVEQDILGGNLLPLVVPKTRSVFELSYEGQAGIHVVEKK